MNVLGIDPSLTGTGLAMHRPLAGSPWSVAQVKTKAPEVASHRASLNRLTHIVREAAAFADSAPDLVVMEGPAFSSGVGRVHERAGLWWFLFNHFAGEVGLPVLVVAPNLRAKYATGRGTAGKDEVMIAAVRRYSDVPITENNTADAVILAAMGARLYGHPIEPSLPSANMAAMRTLSIPHLVET